MLRKKKKPHKSTVPREVPSHEGTATFKIILQREKSSLFIFQSDLALLKLAAWANISSQTADLANAS